MVLKQSWKRVYARDPDMEVGTLKTYNKNDEEETEVEKEDMVEGTVKPAQVQINQKIQRKIVNIFLPINFNICFGCSKEPSH